MQIYQKLLGFSALAQTIFVSTHWPKHDGKGFASAEGRAQELNTDSKLLERFLRRGAKLMKFTYDLESARNILEAIPSISPDRRIPLQIQAELVDQNMALHKTESGRIVAEAVQDMIKFYKLTLKERQEDAKRFTDADRKSAENDVAFYRGLLDRTQRDRKVLATIFRKKLIDGILMLFRITVD